MKKSVILMAMMISQLLLNPVLSQNTTDTTTTTISDTTTTTVSTTTTSTTTTTTISTTSTSTTTHTTSTTITTTTTTSTTTTTLETINITEYIPQQLIMQNITEVTMVGSNLTADDVRDVINNMLDLYQENYTQALVELEIFQKMWDASCMYSETRFEELFEIYSKLSLDAKRCLPKLMTENMTNEMMFSQSCQYSQNNAYYANQLLTEYMRYDLVERRCVTIQLPYQQQAPSGQMVSGQTSYQQCNYYPTRIPSGCIKKIDFINEKMDKRYNDGLGVGMLIILIIDAIAVFILIWRSSGG